jgi:D-glycero-D-manno-heptose 1,7-bisphosphate phosphatase
MGAGESLTDRQQPAVFLDRDGTLIHTRVVDGIPRPPTAIAEMKILPGVPDALRRLKAAGFFLVLVTNQPDVARGALERETVENMHELLRAALPLDAILCCFHDDSARCACRKPRPGMLLEAAERFGLSLSRSYMVGDRWRDVIAGRNAGCNTVLLARAYSDMDTAEADHTVQDLQAAADVIVASTGQTTK